MSSGTSSGIWSTILGALGSLLPAASRRSFSKDRVIHPWRDDSQRTYPSVGLTPSRALALLQSADSGSPAQLFELFSEMLVKWPRLAAVEATRRLALTGLEWEITGDDEPGAEHIVAYCTDALRKVDTFGEALSHLSSALGTGVAVVEIVWESGRVVDLVPVPHARLICDTQEPWRLRVRTQDAPHAGIAVDERPNKWVVHAPGAQLGRPFDGGLLRASLLLFIAQNLSFKDWLIFSQVAGMPVRVAQFEPGISESERQQLLRMLRSLNTDSVAAVTKNIDLKFIESSRAGERPYQAIQEYCNTEVTILWLGQHLTTDVRSSGSRAAAEVHDRVREDLLVHDIAIEGRMIRRQLLAPMVRARFGSGVPTPQFRRSLLQSVDSRALAETLAVAVNQLGIAAPRRWVHRALGIPEPHEDEPVLRSSNATQGPLRN